MFGEEPSCDKESDKEEMPTPSLASLMRRIENIHVELGSIESLTHKIHQSGKVGS